MHQSGSAFQSLHQIGLDGISQDDSSGPGRPKLFCCHRLSVFGVAHYHAAESGAHVVSRDAESQQSHQLRSSSDVKTGLAGHSVQACAETHHDIAQSPVVDVQHSPPSDVVEIYIHLVAVVDVSIQDGRAHVVSSGDGMHVASEMQIQQLHRHDLAESAACSTALDAESRPHGRLAQRDHSHAAAMSETLPETDRGGGFAFAERRWGDG